MLPISAPPYPTRGGKAAGSRVFAESHPHRSTRMREQYYASYAKALYKGCLILCVPCGTHFIGLHETQARFWC